MSSTEVSYRPEVDPGGVIDLTDLARSDVKEPPTTADGSHVNPQDKNESETALRLQFLADFDAGEFTAEIDALTEDPDLQRNP